MTYLTIQTEETGAAAIGVQRGVTRPEDLDRLFETAASTWHWQTEIDFAEASSSWRLLALPTKRSSWQPLTALGRLLSDQGGNRQVNLTRFRRRSIVKVIGSWF